MAIKGLTEKRRLPRMGKIRLGVMIQSDRKCNCFKSNKPDPDCSICRGSGKKYRSKEVDHFVCPPIVQKTYPGEPKELIIVFPTENEEIFFQQFYMKYGYGGLQCKGDGEFATFFDFEKMKFITDKPCPCEEIKNRKCGRVGRLQFMLPEVEEAAGIWQIDTSSKNSIMDINSGIEYIRGICGRISMIPIKLVRSEIETQHPDEKEKKMKKGRHWTMKFSLEGVTLATLQKYGQTDPKTFFLPEPDPNQPEDLREANGALPVNVEENPPKTLPESGEKGEGKDKALPEKSPEAGSEEAKKEISLTLSNGTRRKLSRLQVGEHFESIRGTLGDEKYFNTLGSMGYSLFDEIPDRDMNKVYGEILRVWKESE